MVLSHQELRPGNHCLQHHVGNNVVVKKQELKTNLNSHIWLRPDHGHGNGCCRRGVGVSTITLASLRYIEEGMTKQIIGNFGAAVNSHHRMCLKRSNTPCPDNEIDKLYWPSSLAVRFLMKILAID